MTHHAAWKHSSYALQFDRVPSEYETGSSTLHCFIYPHVYLWRIPEHIWHSVYLSSLLLPVSANKCEKATMTAAPPELSESAWHQGDGNKKKQGFSGLCWDGRPPPRKSQKPSQINCPSAVIKACPKARLYHRELEFKPLPWVQTARGSPIYTHTLQETCS